MFYATGVDWASRDCVVIGVDLSLQNRLEVLRNPMSIMEGVVVVSADIEQDVELTLAVNNANIPDLKAIFLVLLWERAHRLWHSQRISIVSVL